METTMENIEKKDSFWCNCVVQINPEIKVLVNFIFK